MCQARFTLKRVAADVALARVPATWRSGSSSNVTQSWRQLATPRFSRRRCRPRRPHVVPCPAMGATAGDVLELLALAAALAVLLAASGALAAAGAFTPVRPAPAALPRLLVATRPLRRAASAGPATAAVAADLRKRGLLPPAPDSAAAAPGVEGAKGADGLSGAEGANGLSGAEGGDVSSGAEGAGGELAAAPGDGFSAHFGAVGAGEAGAAAASAGVVLAVGGDVSAAAAAAWRRRVARCGLSIAVVEGSGGISACFPWEGRLSDMLARVRLFQRVGKAAACAHGSRLGLRTRDHGFVQLFCGRCRERVVFAPGVPVLEEIRKDLGLPPLRAGS